MVMMWIKEVSFEDLRREKRWLVEIFQNTNTINFNTKFRMVKLADLVIQRRENIDPQKFPTQLFNYIGLENVTTLTGDLVDFEPKPGEKVRSISKVFNSNDILYGRLRPYLNKVYLAQKPVASGICSGEFYVLTPNIDKILPNLLRSTLSSHHVQKYVTNLQTGSALPRLYLDDLMKIYIPYPPMNVQEHIEDFLIRENENRLQLARKLADMPYRIEQSFLHLIEGQTNIEDL
jgi:restriction endonuclease S subunit